jgi:hypothetical protein
MDSDDALPDTTSLLRFRTRLDLPAKSILRRRQFVDKTEDAIDRNLLDQQYPKMRNVNEMLVAASNFHCSRRKLTQSPRFIGFPSTITFAE